MSTLVKSQPINPIVLEPSTDVPFLTNRLSTTARNDLRHWQSIISYILKAPRTGAAIIDAARTSGHTVSQVKYRWERWNSGEPKTGTPKRHWLLLVDLRKHKIRPGTGLPAIFITHWHELITDSVSLTSCLDAHKRLIDSMRGWIRTGEERYRIPGYHLPGATAQPGEQPLIITNSRGIPEGWSYKNLMSHAPQTHTRQAAIGGAKKLSQFLPSVITTRKDVGLFECIVFDDSDQDHYVRHPAFPEAVRPRSFYALDTRTGFSDLILKCPWRETDTNILKGLNEIDFFWWVIKILQTWGYNTETGTTLVFEHGTANTPIDHSVFGPSGDLLSRSISDVTCGLVNIERSGKFNQAVLRNMVWGPKSTGNFRRKGRLESMFNLVRNVAAAFPGATTNNERMRELATLHGQKRELAQLNKLAESLPSDLATRIQYPQPDWEVYQHVMRHVQDTLINGRTGHNLEGWAELGFIQSYFRLSDQGPAKDTWFDQRDFELMDSGMQQLAEAKMNLPGHSRPKIYSPAEALRASAPHAQLRRLTDWEVALVAPQRVWRDGIKVKDDQTLEFKDSLIAPHPIRFYGVLTGEDPSHHIHLKRGETVRLLVSHFDITKAVVAAPDGRILGIAQGIARARAAHDSEGINRQLGAVARIKAENLVELEQATRKENESHQARAAHNASLETEADRRLSERADATKDALRQAAKNRDESPAHQDTEKTRPARL